MAMAMTMALAMGILAQALQSLQLSDGQPDLEARRRALDSLLPLLTASEVRRLKIQLGTSTNDICLAFPPELLLCVAQHLDLEDLITLRSVSRKWNDTFSGEDFCLGIIKTHFRPVWEEYNRCLNADQKLFQKEELMQWLPKAIRGRIRRLQGRYQSKSFLRHDDMMNADWQYKNGRIAYREIRGAIAVKDIRTTSTATYTDQNRLNFGIWHLSDNYLLAAKNGPISLDAWLLTHPVTRSPESIRLPASALRISALENQVAILDTAYQVFIWTIEGPLRSVDTSVLRESLSDFRISQGLVVSHPLNKSCILVIYEAWYKNLSATKMHPRGTFRMIVQEYVEGKATITKLLDLDSVRPGPFDPVGLLHDGIVGLHMGFIAQSWTADAPNNGGLEPHSTSDQREKTDISAKQILIVTYDVYQRKFILEDYYLPIDPRCSLLQRVYQWRDQMFCPLRGSQIERAEHMATQDAEHSLLAINKHRLHASPHDIPCYVNQNTSPYRLPARGVCDVAYYWAGDADEAKDEAIDDIYYRLAGTKSTRRNVIQRDDDFVVLQRSDGWAIWCFDKESSALRDVQFLSARLGNTLPP